MPAPVGAEDNSCHVPLTFFSYTKLIFLLLPVVSTASSIFIGYSISFGVKIFGVNFRVNLGVDFWGLLNDLFFFSFSFLYTLCVVFFLIIFRRFIQS